MIWLARLSTSELTVPAVVRAAGRRGAGAPPAEARLQIMDAQTLARLGHRSVAGGGVDRAPCSECHITAPPARHALQTRPRVVAVAFAGRRPRASVVSRRAAFG